MPVGETSEVAIQEEILRLMGDGRVWTNGELKQRLATALPWTEAELRASPKRPNERVWENRVNNALSKARTSSLYGKGFVDSAGFGEHRITARGLRFISDEDPTPEELAAGM